MSAIDDAGDQAAINPFTGTADSDYSYNYRSGMKTVMDQIQDPATGAVTTYYSDGSSSTDKPTSGAQNVQTAAPLDLSTQIKNLLTGNSSSGAAGQLASIAGIGALLNGVLGSGGAGGYAGYQGSIPRFTANRQQYATPQMQMGSYAPNLPTSATAAQKGNAITQDQLSNYLKSGNLSDVQIANQMNRYGITPGNLSGITGIDQAAIQQRYNQTMGPNAQLAGHYRPGQGGITYFSPMQYNIPSAPAANSTTDTSSTAPAASTPTISPSIQSAINASNMFNGSQLFGNRPDFNTTSYLTAHPDVADSINSGQTMSAYQHYLMYGDNGSKAQNPSYKFIGMANGGVTQSYDTGGIASLGTYSDGGRLLKGPGDGVSDSIPASIGNRQPARLADGEFVVPARIVSELGNGSTAAGARKLYEMMDRVKHARSKANNIAADTKASKYLPA